MKSKACYLLLFLLLPFSLFSHNKEISEYAMSEIPESLKENAHAVVRLSEEKFHIKNPGEGLFEVKKVITILNANGKQYATAYVNYDNKLIKAELLRGEVYDASGKRVRKLKSKDIHDQSVNSSGTFVGDNRIQYAELKHDSYPYTIAFTYVQKFDGLFYYPSFVPQRREKLAVQQASFEVICDAAYPLRYQAHQLDIKPQMSTDAEGKKHYTWKVSQLSPMEREPYAPPFSQLVPVVQIAPSSFSIEGYEGQMNDWKGFGEFMYTLNENRDGIPDELQTKVTEMTAQAIDVKEKIEILYRYMQANTRYVDIQLGIGGYQTFPATYVYENGYGDCKALSNYMKGMLAYLDIPSHLAVIYRGSNPPVIGPGFPINAFNHMILCVPLETDTVWLECTNNHSLPGYLDESTANRYTLLATPEGGKLVRTPSPKDRWSCGRILPTSL